MNNDTSGTETLRRGSDANRALHLLNQPSPRHRLEERSIVGRMMCRLSWSVPRLTRLPSLPLSTATVKPLQQKSSFIASQLRAHFFFSSFSRNTSEAPFSVTIWMFMLHLMSFFWHKISHIILNKSALMNFFPFFFFLVLVSAWGGRKKRSQISSQARLLYNYHIKRLLFLHPADMEHY